MNSQPWRRRAVAFLGADRIARMLALPDGLHVAAIDADFLRNGVRVLVEGESLAPTLEGVEAPRLEVSRLDRTELAMHAEVRGWGPDNAEATVYCPTGRCLWERTWADRAVSLAAIADAVQQHLTLDHRVGL